LGSQFYDFDASEVVEITMAFVLSCCFDTIILLQEREGEIITHAWVTNMLIEP
jgi:hypothetical protein